MDSGRLPAYRSSYLLRFHPYPRMKPSVRERITAATREDEYDGPHQMNTPHLESDTSFTLNHAIYGEIQSRQQRLSMASLVIKLAISFKEKMSLQNN